MSAPESRPNVPTGHGVHSVWPYSCREVDIGNPTLAVTLENTCTPFHPYLVRGVHSNKATPPHADDACKSRTTFDVGLSLLRVRAVMTHVAKCSRRAWRARRVGVAICRVKRPRGAADTGRRIGLPIRPKPDRAGSPLPAERALHEGYNTRNHVRILGQQADVGQGHVTGARERYG